MNGATLFLVTFGFWITAKGRLAQYVALVHPSGDAAGSPSTVAGAVGAAGSSATATSVAPTKTTTIQQVLNVAKSFGLNSSAE